MNFRTAQALSLFVDIFLDFYYFSWKFFFHLLLALSFYIFFNLTPVYSGLGSFLLYLATGGWRFAKVVYRTIGRDFQALLYLINVRSVLQTYERTGENVITLFQKTVLQHSQKTAFILVDGRQWTFREVDELSNIVANHFYGQGYRKGDVVALFMESQPEFVVVWLGLAKIGVISALVNFNLRLEVLVNSIRSSNAKSLIFSAAFRKAVLDIQHLLPVNFNFYCKCNENCQENGFLVIHLESVLNKALTFPPPKLHVAHLNEKLFYIYTSGTTGVPKAAIVSHARFIYVSRTVYHFFKLTPDDVIYNVLPLYHSAGGVLGVGLCFLNGCTLVIRRKFSASRFWDDCYHHNCTAAQYIGEICRYLLAQPPRPVERIHKVSLVFGNGLRPQIWKQFQERFRVKRIGEFYGATEGNANLINPDNIVGAVGFQSRILPFVYPVTLVKVDETTGALMRNSRGLCIRCQPGEPGELVGKIVKGSHLRHFDGYANEEATRKKMVFNVFRRGDCYFLTGDILQMDEYGYIYFRDRTGDTFRWKGENVSTAEVEGVISNITGLKDAVVYGVEIPGTEGRAGMVAIINERMELDVKQLNHSMQQCLPRYAQPVFLRLVNKLDMTETFKMKKTSYQKDGYNPSCVVDHLFYLNPISSEYAPLDQKIYEDICCGTIRF